MIEKLLIEATDAFLAANKDNRLIFGDPANLLLWNSNLFTLTSPDKAEPLSLLLIQKNPERVSSGDDDILIATLSKFLQKPTWYFRSFQCAWQGKTNSSMSISGFLLGEKLRKKFLIKRD